MARGVAPRGAAAAARLAAWRGGTVLAAQRTATAWRGSAAQQRIAATTGIGSSSAAWQRQQHQRGASHRMRYTMQTNAAAAKRAPRAAASCIAAPAGIMAPALQHAHLGAAAASAAPQRFAVANMPSRRHQRAHFVHLCWYGERYARSTRQPRDSARNIMAARIACSVGMRLSSSRMTRNARQPRGTPWRRVAK